MILNKLIITNFLQELLQSKKLQEIKDKIDFLKKNIQTSQTNKIVFINIVNDGNTIKDTYIFQEKNQIFEIKILERTKYYIQRLIKSWSEKKTNKINDINLKKEKYNFNYEIKMQVIVDNSENVNYKKILEKNKSKGARFFIMHPLYWDIIKFTI